MLNQSRFIDELMRSKAILIQYYKIVLPENSSSA